MAAEGDYERENGVAGAHVHRCVGMACDEVRFSCSFPRFTALVSHPKVMTSLSHSSVPKPFFCTNSPPPPPYPPPRLMVSE